MARPDAVIPPEFILTRPNTPCEHTHGLTQIYSFAFAYFLHNFKFISNIIKSSFILLVSNCFEILCMFTMLLMKSRHDSVLNPNQIWDCIFRRGSQHIKQWSRTTYEKLNYRRKAGSTVLLLCGVLTDFLLSSWIVYRSCSKRCKVLADERSSAFISSEPRLFIGELVFC